MASLCEITPMGRKKKALREPPGPTLDTLRSWNIGSLTGKLMELADIMVHRKVPWRKKKG